MAALATPSPALSKHSYEAIVVGSGFGGAVAACRLAQAGVDVAILERGRRFDPGSFPRPTRTFQDVMSWHRGGPYDVRPLNDVLVVQAAGYGGGSLIYANVQMRPPPHVFEDGWLSLAAGIGNAWVLLVEVVRDERYQPVRDPDRR